MIKHLRLRTRQLFAASVLALAPLMVSSQAEAGQPCCVPQPTVTRAVVVRSPECPSICTTVNVCLPACVAHLEPCVSSRPTLFGRGLVHLSWSGGPTVSVRFTNHGPRVFYH